MFRALLHRTRTGAPSPSLGNHTVAGHASSQASAGTRSRLALALLPIALVLAAGVAPALAASPPQINKGNLGQGAIGPRHTTQNSAGQFHAEIQVNGAETQWSFEYATAEGGPWTPVSGGSGTITAAEAAEFSQHFLNAGEVTGLTPETTYYVRLTVTNIAGTDSAIEPFEIVPLRPLISGLGIQNVTSTSVDIHGSVIPDNFETHWRFEYATSENGLWSPAPGAEGSIPQAEADEEYHQVAASLIGLSPGTTYYVRLFAENEHGEAVLQSNHKQKGTAFVVTFETAGPPAATTFAVHTFHGETQRALGAVRSDGFDSNYHFQYVTQHQFEQPEHGGFAEATDAPELDAGPGEYSESIPGFPTKLLGEDLPGLLPGTTYHYRIVATNERGTVDGKEQTLTVPPAPEAGPEEPCPNQAARTGFSARLPDCRAYEQVTPAEKEGAMDIGTYGNLSNEPRVGEDGNHFILTAPGTQWGPSPDPKASNYSFSRSITGWQMTSVTPQPEAGGSTYSPAIFNPDLTQLGVEVGWATTPHNASEEVELKAGLPGGPYARAASMPRKDAEGGSWVAASADFSKLILRTDDRTLVPGHPSATAEGADLYEYSRGQLRQLNVFGSEEEISNCGAQMAKGFEGFQAAEQPPLPTSSAHAVSADGFRAFFTDNCTHHLYMRVNGTETIDIGGYTFLAANAEGTELLLERKNGTTDEVLLYDTETAAVKVLTSTHERSNLIVSGDLTAFYFQSQERLPPTEAPPSEGGSDLYRYDISTETLSFVANISESESVLVNGQSVSPDGRYYYLSARTLGGVRPEGAGSSTTQVYRYDSSEDVVQCMSCASSFNPEPKLAATFLFGQSAHGGSVPDITVSSANGDYVFFDTTAALLPSDVDGEIPPDPTLKSEYVEFFRSPSSDTYEWRRNGVDACAHPQGCLSLISGGIGGYKDELLGATPSGRDVFFATHESLAPTDADAAGDIYDARIGGGFPPPPPRPVECEGDACHHPATPPTEPTLSTSVASGSGNEHQEHPKKKKQPKHRRKSHKKRHVKTHKRAGHSHGGGK